MKNRNVVVNYQVILNRGLYRWAAPRNVFVRGLINDGIQDLQRLSCLLRNRVRGRFQIKFAMTSLFNKSGFTLIELLVVVLIIGILAAIALPQYQKAVKHSTYAGMLPVLASVVEAQQLYYMTHGTYAKDAEELTKLEIDFPITGTCINSGIFWLKAQGDGAKIGNYCVYLTGNSKTGIFIGLSESKWGMSYRDSRMSGFEYLLSSDLADRPAGKTYCRERFIIDGTPRNDFHCKGTLIRANWDAAWFAMD